MSFKTFTSILWSVSDEKLKPKVYLSPCIVEEDIVGWGIPISPSFSTEEEAIAFQKSVENLMEAYEESLIKGLHLSGVKKRDIFKIKKFFKETRKTMSR